MEASRFGFDPSLPQGSKFDPTDADIVAYYLLPRAVDHLNPHEHAVIDADPCSCPPWELMRRHGHAGSDHAFFFGPTTKSGGHRANRTVPAEEGGGVWHGQTSVETDLVLVPRGGDGREINIKYKKCQFSYLDSERKATGWVMHEYLITDPPLPVPGAVISRIRMDPKSKKKKKQQQPAPANNDSSALVNTGEPGCAVASSTAGKSPSMRAP
ncbi:unnamed protein product [Urochloa decumbens]|uniref:NAC domain-containing protein n=1 Tax=Urochloa decumbens TaxID=240449 RepID=A0ABC8XJ79_9POAL